MSTLDERALEHFARYICREQNAGDGMTFSVIVDDPDAETYGVRARAFHDADRAGFSDYINEDFITGISQMDAAHCVKILEKAQRKIKKEREARYA